MEEHEHTISLIAEFDPVNAIVGIAVDQRRVYVATAKAVYLITCNCIEETDEEYLN